MCYSGNVIAFLRFTWRNSAAVASSTTLRSADNVRLNEVTTRGFGRGAVSDPVDLDDFAGTGGTTLVTPDPTARIQAWGLLIMAANWEIPNMPTWPTCNQQSDQFVRMRWPMIVFLAAGRTKCPCMYICVFRSVIWMSIATPAHTVGSRYHRWTIIHIHHYMSFESIHKLTDKIR